MKRGKAHNSFPDEVRQLFLDNWECWYCKMNTMDAGHHIMGRGNGDSIVERSALNFAPMCNFKCHLPKHGMFRTDEWASKFLIQTRDYLERIGYEWKEIDQQFYDKYQHLYDVRT